MIRRVWAVIALALVGACGRIGFDASGGGGGGGGGGDGGSGSDARGSDAPPDAMADCTPFDLTSGTTTSSFGVSGLAWTGAGYVMFREDGLVTVSEMGVVGPLHTLSPSLNLTYAGQDSIAWSGTRLAVVWVSPGGAIQFRLYDATLAPMGTATELVASGGIEPHVIWADTVFVATWRDSTGEISIEELTADGTPLGVQSSMSAGTITHVESLIATAGKYLVAVYVPGNAALYAFDRPLTGTLTTPAIALGASSTDYVQLANIANGGVIVQAAGTGTGPGKLQQLAGDGTAAASAITMPMDGAVAMNYATVVPDGTSARVVGITGAAPTQIVTTHYDSGGGTLQPAVEVTTQAVTTYSPVSARRVPGRLLIAIPYADGGGVPHTRIIQLCQ
jgi:hypothetical protein